MVFFSTSFTSCPGSSTSGSPSSYADWHPAFEIRHIESVFTVANTIHLLSTFMTLEPGDVLVMGTPGGVGVARDPQVWMKAGDICEVEIEGIGLLSNRVVAE